MTFALDPNFLFDLSHFWYAEPRSLFVVDIGFAIVILDFPRVDSLKPLVNDVV